eukprot:CAMPEP_0197041876 /NCGR_PEP_ID=MMETSP1384-20130603/18353_1 /TAXON_ID=29189 /ORGANISM="Ammonia sp." /LENGTH=38 /DNA_ID= /DNA_START= /DNA_END= /DNA_ORIENTATION=
MLHKLLFALVFILYITRAVDDLSTPDDVNEVSTPDDNT